MNKFSRGAVIFVGIILLASAGWLAISSITSRARLSVDVKTSNITYELNDKDDNKIAEFDKNRSFYLKKGEYTITPKSDDYRPMELKLDKGMALTVDPDYSEKYYQAIEKTERPKIESAIMDKYGHIMDNFTFSNGKFINKGEYYILLIKQEAGPFTLFTDIYRVVLKMSNEGWRPLHDPELILNIKKYPQIPENIIREANKLKDESNV